MLSAYRRQLKNEDTEFLKQKNQKRCTMQTLKKTIMLYQYQTK